MANVTITSSGTDSTYSLTAPLTNNGTIDFLNDSGMTNGVLILTDNGQGSAFNITTDSITGYGANIGGKITHFEAGAFGVGGDQVTIQVIKDLFAELLAGGTANPDYNDLVGDITAAAQNGNQMLVLPDGSIDLTPGTHFTLDASEKIVIDDVAQALFGTAAAADGATLDLSFAERVDPNSNNKFIDGIVTTTDTEINPCFAAGTRILTPRGEIAVEALAVGDRLITRDGAEQPIIWIGRRDVDITAFRRPDTMRPVIIDAGALGDGIPARRLLLSPDHGLFIDNLLVPAKELLNWTTIRQDITATRVTYYHLELARHDIIFAESMPVETYLDTGHRGIFDNAESLVIAHPALMQQRRERESCAPLCVSGPALDGIRQRLASRQVGIRLAGA